MKGTLAVTGNKDADDLPSGRFMARSYGLVMLSQVIAGLLSSAIGVARSPVPIIVVILARGSHGLVAVGAPG